MHCSRNGFLGLSLLLSFVMLIRGSEEQNIFHNHTVPELNFSTTSSPSPYSTTTLASIPTTEITEEPDVQPMPNATVNDIIEDLTNKLEKCYNQTEMSRAYECRNSTVGIDFLLVKLRGETDELIASLHPVDTRDVTALDLPSPSGTLATIQKLSSRLNALGTELSTEIIDDCSMPLIRKLDNMTKELKILETNEGNRLKEVLVRDSVQNIVTGKFERVKEELAEITKLYGATFEIDLVIQGIIDTTLSESFPDTFQNLLRFLKILHRQNFKSGMKFLIDAMKSSSHIDSNQFLRLAYESKGAFGSELKKNFPDNFQQLIWGGTQCIRNRLTNQFLVNEKNVNQENNTQSDSNSTQSTTDRPNGRTKSKNKFTVLTTVVPRKDTGKVNNHKGRNAFCGWEFYPLVADNSLHFIIRQKINKNWGWNLNVDVRNNNTVQVSPIDVNEHFIWEISPQDEGQYFSLTSLNPLLEINDTMHPNNFICSKTNRSSTREVVVNSYLDNYCKWVLENPFEMQRT